MTVSNLSSVVVETAMVETAEDEVVAVEAASVAMASVAVDVVAPGAGAAPAVMLPRRRPRGRASATCGGDEDWVMVQALKRRTVAIAVPVYNITCISSQTYPGAPSVRTSMLL